MRYEDFFEIARYANENWKGGYTKEEYIQLAKEYFESYQWSLLKKAEQEKVDHIMISLLDGLCEDWANGNGEPVKWIKQMITELGLVDINFQDYKNEIYLVDFIRREMM